MTYLSNVTNERPMLRISATIILAFTCAAPFVLLISGVVGYGVRSLNEDPTMPVQRARDEIWAAIAPELGL